MKVQADIKNIKLELKNELEHLNLTILNDKNRLSQVIINLISNALKFSDKLTGVIELIVSKNQNNLIKFKIKDNGSGMMKQTINNLGKIYFS